MKKTQKNSKEYINELEDKIIDLSLKLKKQSKLLELEETNNNELINKLTHNLKNPIGIAYSFSDMMLEDSINYTPEKLEKHLKIVKESSEYAINLLNTFVIFQTIKSSNCEYKFELKDYSELVTTVVNDITTNSENKNINLQNSIPNETILLAIDAEKIVFVLKQLLNNAIRFSEENSIIKINITKHNSTVETIITDEGIGISEEDLNNVFKDFYVVNTYDLYKQKCIGLGLSTAKNILKKHGGTISIKSNNGKGTTVKIKLPINI